ALIFFRLPELAQVQFSAVGRGVQYLVDLGIPAGNAGEVLGQELYSPALVLFGTDSLSQRPPGDRDRGIVAGDGGIANGAQHHLLVAHGAEYRRLAHPGALSDLLDRCRPIALGDEELPRGVKHSPAGHAGLALTQRRRIAPAGVDFWHVPRLP